MNSPQTRSAFRQLSVVIGPTVACLVSGALSLPDRRSDSGFTLANIALVMAIVTVGFAIVDAWAGVTTSIAAALALNYFHTEPYRTLRINDRRDIYSVVLLGVLGLAVSGVTVVRVRRRLVAIRQGDAVNVGSDLSRLLNEDQPAVQIWSMAIRASANDLGLVQARLARQLPDGLRSIRRSMAHDTDPTLLLPTLGAALELRSGHAEGRWLVLTPRLAYEPVVLDRRAVLAFADSLELGLEAPPVAIPVSH
jgi:K+-sensing histidine kinase KdpD